MFARLGVAWTALIPRAEFDLRINPAILLADARAFGLRIPVKGCGLKISRNVVG